MFARIAITILISLLGLLTKAQENRQDNTKQEGVTIIVKIPKISVDNGKVYFSLYDSEKNFISRIPFQRAIGDIVDKSTEIKFTNVPEGTYAIICFHDINDNKQLDFNGFMPVEDYGASNNPVIYGPPKFGLSRFIVEKEDIGLTITF